MDTVPDGRGQDDNPDLGEGEWAILGQVLMSHITLQVYSVGELNEEAWPLIITTHHMHTKLTT